MPGVDGRIYHSANFWRLPLPLDGPCRHSDQWYAFTCHSQSGRRYDRNGHLGEPKRAIMCPWFQPMFAGASLPAGSCRADTANYFANGDCLRRRKFRMDRRQFLRFYAIVVHYLCHATWLRQYSPAATDRQPAHNFKYRRFAGLRGELCKSGRRNVL